MGFRAPGFDLAQPWLLHPSGEELADGRSLGFSVCVSLLLCLSNKFLRSWYEVQSWEGMQLGIWQ